MRILLYSINYHPELTGIGKYNGELAEWFTKNGYEFLVITAPPYYPNWKVAKGYSSWMYRNEEINGVKVVRCPVWVPEKPNGLKRIIHLLSFAISSFPVVVWKWRWKPNLIIAVEPPLFVAPTALLVSWLSKSKSWLHIQDFEVDAAFDLGILSARFLRNVVLNAEKLLMSRFDRVSTISDSMERKLRDKGVQKDRSLLFPNWVDVDRIVPKFGPNSFRVSLNIPDKKVVCLYSGNMGEKQGLEIVVDAARLLSDEERVLFVMCGHGSAYESLRNLAQGLPNIYWLPLQPVEMVNELLNLADIHLLPQRADAADLVMPSKLTGMMASGRPVLATVAKDSLIASVLKDCGVIVSPGDAVSFTREIVKLVQNEEQRDILGRNAREFAKNNLSQEAILSKFERDIMNLIESERLE